MDSHLAGEMQYKVNFLVNLTGLSKEKKHKYFLKTSQIKGPYFNYVSM